MIKNGKWYSFNIWNTEFKSNMEIDYDKLALAIAKAKQLEKEIEKQEKAEALAKWQKEIGYNEHMDKKGLVKKFFCFCNSLKVAWNIMFISRKKHIATSPTNVFFQGISSAFFSVVQYALAVIAAGYVIVLFYHPGVQYKFGECFMCCMFAIISFMLSRIFRLMVIEIEQMSNREQVLGIFTAVMSVYQLVEKVARLFQGVGQ